MVDEDRQLRKYEGTTTEDRLSPDLDWRDQGTTEHHSRSCLTGGGHAWSQASRKVSAPGSPLYLYTWMAGMTFHRLLWCDLQQVRITAKERREERLQAEKWMFKGSFFPATPGVEQEISGCLL